MNDLPDRMVVINDDVSIRQMLVRQGIQEPVRNEAMTFDAVACNDSGVKWIVFHFHVPGDGGYIAYGIPAESTDEKFQQLVGFVLSVLENNCSEQGMDMWGSAVVIPMSPAANN